MIQQPAAPPRFPQDTPPASPGSCDSLGKMRSPLLRSALALLLFTAWLALLFSGHAGGGAVHLLLAGSAVLFPWTALRA